MTLYVGQKVVALETWIQQTGLREGPVKGQVYTIRRCEPGISPDGEEMGLWFAELSNPIMTIRSPFGLREDEPGFPAKYFRPAVDLNDLQSIVTEVFQGKPRKIKDDQFDKQRVTG